MENSPISKRWAGNFTYYTLFLLHILSVLTLFFNIIKITIKLYHSHIFKTYRDINYIGLAFFSLFGCFEDIYIYIYLILITYSQFNTFFSITKMTIKIYHSHIFKTCRDISYIELAFISLFGCFEYINIYIYVYIYSSFAILLLVIYETQCPKLSYIFLLLSILTFVGHLLT